MPTLHAALTRMRGNALLVALAAAAVAVLADEAADALTARSAGGAR
ncbi:MULTISPECIES: hypothetical protein [unclassified Frankia]|nr:MULTISPECIES: hypothetical protein [unclassified Frankia]